MNTYKFNPENSKYMMEAFKLFAQEPNSAITFVLPVVNTSITKMKVTTRKNTKQFTVPQVEENLLLRFAMEIDTACRELKFGTIIASVVTANIAPMYWSITKERSIKLTKETHDPKNNS